MDREKKFKSEKNRFQFANTTKYIKILGLAAYGLNVKYNARNNKLCPQSHQPGKSVKISPDDRSLEETEVVNAFVFRGN